MNMYFKLIYFSKVGACTFQKAEMSDEQKKYEVQKKVALWLVKFSTSSNGERLLCIMYELITYKIQDINCLVVLRIKTS